MQIRIEICIDVLLDILIYYFINHRFAGFAQMFAFIFYVFASVSIDQK